MNNAESKLSLTEKNKREHLKLSRPLVYEKVIRYHEKIKKGESIAIIQFQYNYGCNFKCKHCCTSNMQKKKRYFKISDVEDLSRQADQLGLAHFTITGGEPLIFKDLDELVKAINPDKFFIAMDSNGWFLDEEKAKHLKNIGIEKVHLSLDSLSADEHDNFRQKPGSYNRVLKAIDASLDAGLAVLLNTVVTKQRVYSQEFLDFLELTKSLDVPVVMMLAKTAGAWEGNYDVVLDENDLRRVRELEKQYNAFTHLVPAYGLDLGCIAVKRMISITRYGDIMPCPWIHTSLGNFFDEPLGKILERGMKIKFFGSKIETCLGSVEGDFLKNYVKKMEGKPFPVPYTEVFSEKDFLI